ncbi:MAG: cytochrome c [Saprospiraceae bacterium]
MKNSIFLLVFLVIWFSNCNDTPYMQGNRLYTQHCQNCHMADGTGLSNLIPALTSSKKLGNPSVACILKNGLRDTIWSDTTFLVKEMPSFKHLSATEVANIVNYIHYKWYKDFDEFTIIDIQEALDNCN